MIRPEQVYVDLSHDEGRPRHGRGGQLLRPRLRRAGAARRRHVGAVADVRRAPPRPRRHRPPAGDRAGPRLPARGRAVTLTSASRRREPPRVAGPRPRPLRRRARRRRRRRRRSATPPSTACVADRARTWGPERRLVLVEGANDLDSLVAYLAALQHGHVALVVPDGRAAPSATRSSRPTTRTSSVPPATATTYAVPRPRTTSTPTSRSCSARRARPGSPKLVRLSRDNVASNAAAIADYLALTPADRAITALPLHYCYGLSVLHSHLVAGASVVLTGLSVVDECFWDLFARTGATTLAGVPHTFDLLATSGFEAPRPADAAPGDPGRRPPRPRRRTPLEPLRPQPRLGPRRDVRRDRGDRADGVPPAAPHHGPPRRDRRRRSGRPATPRRGCGRAGRSRRARLLRPERHARLRRVARRPRARPRGRPSCAPATSPARSTGCSRSSAGSTAAARSSACGSTSTASSATSRPRSTGAPGSSRPTGPSTSSSPPAAAARPPGR